MDTKPKRLLIVTYVFPPFAAVGVYRILKFCKYLPDFGINPVILTPSKPNTVSQDEGLRGQIPHYVPVHHTPIYEPFRWKPAPETAQGDKAKPELPAREAAPPRHRISARMKKRIKDNLTIPDGSYLWSWTGLWKGLQAIRTENIDLILSSSPPHSTHLLASRLSARTRKPLIVDFRDLWTQNTSYAERELSPVLRRRDRRYEVTTLRQSSGITVNTETFKRQLLDNNSFLDANRIAVVTNGVDPDDFREFVVSGTGQSRFTILHAGSLYGNHRNPEFFFAAIREWFQRSPELAAQMRIVFIGNWASEFTGLIDRYDLGAVVEKRAWMPQREALKETFAADLLLVFQGFDPVLSAAIPRKLFEYLIINKPILAFAPPGEIPDLITRYECGASLATPSAGPIIEYLDKAFAEWKHRRETGQVTHALRSMPDLESKQQVAKLAELCHRLA